MKIEKNCVLGSFETIFPIFVKISVIISYIMIYLAVKGLSIKPQLLYFSLFL